MAKPGEPSWPSPWRGSARLAQRMRRDEPRPARRGLRPALRRDGSASSRITRTSVPRRSPWASVRRPLDAQRLRRRRRGREDVEEPRQRRQPPRPDGSVRPACLSHAVAAVALPRSGARSVRTTSTRRSTHCAGLDSFAVAARSRSSLPRPTATCWPGSRTDGRRPRHTRRDGVVVRHRARGQTPRSIRRRCRSAVTRGRGARDVHGVRPGAQRRRRRAGRGGGQGRPPSMLPAAPRTSPPPTAIRAELQALVWTVETTKAGTTVRR